MYYICCKFLINLPIKYSTAFAPTYSDVSQHFKPSSLCCAVVPLCVSSNMANTSKVVDTSCLDKYKPPPPPPPPPNEMCIFCIIAEQDDAKEILATECDLMIIKDVRPAAFHHYLVLPREHLGNPSFLKQEHIPLLKRMKKFAMKFMKKLITENEFSRLSVGCHWPPYTTVDHLHFHFLHPVTDFTVLNEVRFKKNEEYFLTVEEVISRIPPDSEEEEKENLFNVRVCF